MKHLSLAAVASFLILGIIAPAQAYIGPGPGLSMVGSFFTLIGGIILALLMVLAYPIRLLLKRRKNKRSDTPGQ